MFWGLLSDKHEISLNLFGSKGFNKTKMSKKLQYYPGFHLILTNWRQTASALFHSILQTHRRSPRPASTHRWTLLLSQKAALQCYVMTFPLCTCGQIENKQGYIYIQEALSQRKQVSVRGMQMWLRDEARLGQMARSDSHLTVWTSGGQRSGERLLGRGREGRAALLRRLDWLSIMNEEALRSVKWGCVEMFYVIQM